MIRELLSAGMVIAVAALIATWLSIEGRAQTKAPLTGEWTLNPSTRSIFGCESRRASKVEGGRREQ
jgi:hypothetical protein